MTLRTNNIELGDGSKSVTTEYVINGTAKAWAKWNGNGTTAIQNSQNVSSLTDNGTGDYTVNLSSVMNDANYSYSVNGEWTVGSDGGLAIYTVDNRVLTTSSIRTVFTSISWSNYDVDGCSMQIFGDLA